MFSIGIAPATQWIKKDEEINDFVLLDLSLEKQCEFRGDDPVSF